MVLLEGTVAERVYVGTTTQVIIELSPGSRVVALEQNTHRSRADNRWEIGEKRHARLAARSTRSCCVSRYGLSRRPVEKSQTLQPTESAAITAVTPSDSQIDMSLWPRKP